MPYTIKDPQLDSNGMVTSFADFTGNDDSGYAARRSGVKPLSARLFPYVYSFVVAKKANP